MSKNDHEKAKEEYWRDPDQGKQFYDGIRGPCDADPDEWERNLWREEADEEDDE